MPRAPHEPIDPEIMQVAGSMQRPVPGQSLTNDPENPYPFEKPPKFTNLKQAQQEIATKLMEEDTYEVVMNAVANGTPVMDITSNIRYAGFRSGKWNPDLMMLLAEPTAYIVMALAERAGIEDYVIDNDEDEEEQPQTPTAEAMIKSKAPTGMKEGVLPPEVQETIEQAPSLMEKPDGP